MRGSHHFVYRSFEVMCVYGVVREVVVGCSSAKVCAPVCEKCGF